MVAQGGEAIAKYGDWLIKEYLERLTNELGVLMMIEFFLKNTF